MGNSGKKPIKTGHFIAQSLLQKWAIAHPGLGNRSRLWGIIPIKKQAIAYQTKNMNKQQDPTAFGLISLPYVLQRQEDGTYLVLNRKYKPIGFLTEEWVHYEDYPIAQHFVRKTIEKLSIPGSRDGDIYLYNDATIPTIGEKNKAAYLEKIAILMKLDVY